jgi:hypothetical protein
MTKNRKPRTFPFPDIRELLKTGISFRHISAITNYSPQELSLMAKCWGLHRKLGRAPRPKVNVNQ